MNKKILILGAKGNLGRQLMKVFSNGIEYPIGYPIPLDSRLVALDKNELDITNKELILEKIKEIKPDIIINAAAYNAVDKCEEDEKEFDLAKKINGKAPGILAPAALENNAILIHYSSDYVFDGENKNGYKEDDEPNPISKYGETKLMGENAIMNLTERGLKYYIIRTSKLFGKKGKSKASKENFFDIMLKLAKEKSEIDVVNEEVSCFTYTPDLAKATRDLVENKKPYGIYHIVNNGACTWYEAAKELFDIANVKVKVKVNPVTSDKFLRPAKRPKYSVLLNTKLKPLRDWREALCNYIKIK
jgi:dTDP-4-dehydrorhamnose reductase